MYCQPTSEYKRTSKEKIDRAILIKLHELKDFCESRDHSFPEIKDSVVNYHINCLDPYPGVRLLSDAGLIACQEHATMYNSETITNKIIMLGHPFFVEISQNPLKKAMSYIRNIFKVISKSNNDPEWSVAQCTFPLLYRPKIVEIGLINKVLFTWFTNGELLEKPQGFDDKELVFLGCYADKCLHTIITEFAEQTSARLSIIPEGVLYHQTMPEGVECDNHELTRRLMQDQEFPREVRILPLNEFLNP